MSAELMKSKFVFRLSIRVAIISEHYARISEHYSSYKSQPIVFKLLNFLPNVLHQTTFGIFEIWKI